MIDSIFGYTCLGLILSRCGAQLWLEKLNQDHVKKHAAGVPPDFAGFMDDGTYSKSVEYTLARSRFHCLSLVWDTLWLCLALFSGALPWAYSVFSGSGAGAWVAGAFLAITAVALSLPDLPLDWYSQFRLEERFGFNASTPKLWWTDRLKGLLLGLALGYPLVVLILKLVDWLGPAWWIWAWACVLVFQMVMMVAAPVLILPLFNKLTPLSQGELRERLFALAARTGFQARDIQVMDGSKRSRHSNAFFTGLGRFRRIVLFDTLIDQLNPAEREAVLAHEIGHYKRRHIPKMLAGSALGLLAGFFILAVLARQDWFYRGFGFAPGRMAPAMLLFGLLAGVFMFWISPLANRWSRKFEYEADAYAAIAINQAQPLIDALRKLNEKNLSNLTPHPFYSRFYYSHPTLIERTRRLANL
jgi:STE24 endopeptidase